MTRIADDITGLIGGTPLVRLGKIAAEKERKPRAGGVGPKPCGTSSGGQRRKADKR